MIRGEQCRRYSFWFSGKRHTAPLLRQRVPEVLDCPESTNDWVIRWIVVFLVGFDCTFGSAIVMTQSIPMRSIRTYPCPRTATATMKLSTQNSQLIIL